MSTAEQLDTPMGEQSAPAGADRSSAVTRWLIRLLFLSVVVGSVATMFADVPRETVGIAAIVLLLALLLAKVPVGIALAVPGMLGLRAILGGLALENVLTELPFDTVASWSLSVIPMFVLMGMLLANTGISTRIYIAARHWLGWLPGGLAVGTTAVGAGTAAVSGTSLGSTYALARIGIPEMLRAGYHRKLAIGSIAVSGIIGQLIPPSVLLVVYAGIAQVPVGQQLIAGFAPGLLLAASVMATVVVACMLRPRLDGREAPDAAATPSRMVTWGQRLRSVVDIWPVPVLIFAILGGIFSGALTATEAGAAGAFGALLLTLWYRRGDGPFRAMWHAAGDTSRAVGAIFLVIIGAMIFSRLLSVTGLIRGFTDWVVTVGLGRVEFLLILLVAYLVMGMFLDPLSMMLLTVPLLLPTVEALGISLPWFGIFTVLVAELAVITPPVGILCFIIQTITRSPEVNCGREITLGDVFRSVGWLLPVAFGVVGLLILFPEIVTALPNRM